LCAANAAISTAAKSASLSYLHSLAVLIYVCASGSADIAVGDATMAPAMPTIDSGQYHLRPKGSYRFIQQLEARWKQAQRGHHEHI
jgi:hypothetical protein